LKPDDLRAPKDARSTDRQSLKPQEDQLRQQILMSTVFCVLALATSSANAGLSLTLSSPDNLSALTVGQTFEVDVKLSGLPFPNNTTDFVFNLNSKVLFSSSLFTTVPDASTLSGLTATVTAGSVFDNVVQGPLQVANFDFNSAANGGLSAGSATGIFAQTPNTNSGAIGLNGLYYSFLLKATSVGSGSIQFDPTPGANEYAADDTGFNYAPFSSLGGPLSFTIGSAAVPEPSSIVMGAIGVVVLAYAGHARRRPAAA
jgi:hypothetical protein